MGVSRWQNLTQYQTTHKTRNHLLFRLPNKTMNTTDIHTMPDGMISLTTKQLMDMLAKARAEGRTENVSHLAASAVNDASPPLQAPLQADAPVPPKPSKGGKGKRKRLVLADGTEVKNPSSAYIFYCKEFRIATKEAHPELKSTQLTAKLGAQWKALTEEEKGPYNTLAEKDKARYAAQAAEAMALSSDGHGKTPRQALMPPVLPGDTTPETSNIQPCSPPTSVFKTPSTGGAEGA